MHLIATHELSRHTENELSALFAAVTCKLTQSKPDTPARRNALASLENISKARALRLCRPR